MGQTQASCELLRCSDCCSMHKHISPRRPCSATAKPLSRKVNITSVSPLSIFPHLSYTIHAIHQPSHRGQPNTCSSSKGYWIRRPWGGWLQQQGSPLWAWGYGVIAAGGEEEDVDLPLQYTDKSSISGQSHWQCHSYSNQKDRQCRHCQIYSMWHICFAHLKKICSILFFMATCFLEMWDSLHINWFRGLTLTVRQQASKQSCSYFILLVEVIFKDWIWNNHWWGKAFFLF